MIYHIFLMFLWRINHTFGKFILRIVAMERFILDKMLAWKGSRRRKPLIVQGPRQVGKTWAVQKFGKEHFPKYIYLNFEKRPQYCDFFVDTKDPHELLEKFSGVFGKIDLDTLIIFDEIQECPEALNSLKYFQEEAPEYYVIAAGSLLGLKLNQGFPVGKVNFLSMQPLSFFEFLEASGEHDLLECLLGLKEISPIPEAYQSILKQHLKTYFLYGGMPEVVNEYLKNSDMEEAEDILDEILLSYHNDFGKHSDKVDNAKVRLIYDSLPSQLARENKKFIYRAIRSGARAREYESALEWLKNAEMVRKVSRIEKPSLPLSAYEDPSSFKIFANDIGLLRRKSRLPATSLIEGDRLFSEFKGALTENYVLLSLLGQSEETPYYWSKDPYEVDFLIQTEQGVIPIEVKSGENIKAPSLKSFLKTYPETPLGVRISLLNLSYDGKILNVPLYLCDNLLNIIKLALSDTSKPH